MACSVIAGPRLPMATPTERAQVYFANASLLAPLPTPPRSKMLPLLPTPCLVLLPVSPPSEPTPNRADADERWDARKNTVIKAPSVSLPSRADAVERWDAHKVKPALSTSASSSSMSSNSSISSGASSSSLKWNINKKRAISRAASAERCDAKKKKPQQPQTRELDDDDGSSTGSNHMELDTPPQQAFHAGPGFLASPEPGMLPMPSFMVRVA